MKGTCHQSPFTSMQEVYLQNICMIVLIIEFDKKRCITWILAKIAYFHGFNLYQQVPLAGARPLAIKMLSICNLFHSDSYIRIKISIQIRYISIFFWEKLILSPAGAFSTCCDVMIMKKYHFLYLKCFIYFLYHHPTAFDLMI